MRDGNDVPADEAKEWFDAADVDSASMPGVFLAVGVVGVDVLLPIGVDDGIAAVDDALVEQGDVAHVPGFGDPAVALQAHLDVWTGFFSGQDEVA